MDQEKELNTKKKVIVYIAKENTWFDAGSICVLIDDFRPGMNSGVFYGWRTCENPAAEGRLFGERFLKEEVCMFDEFDVIEF